MANNKAPWWSWFIAVNGYLGQFASSPMVHYSPAKPVRTTGADGMILQPVTETPLYDPSGPTVPNRRAIVFLEGAILPASSPSLGLAGSWGVPNEEQLGVDGLLDPYDTAHLGQASG
jgi:hypothetical protein